MSQDTGRTTPYDPDEDPDTDPEQLNPRTGEQADGGEEGAGDRTDADPASLNPRTGGAAGDTTD